MQDTVDLLYRLVSWLLTPATFFGTVGAIVSPHTKGASRKHVVTVWLGGAAAANMTMPLIQEHSPESWHYTLFFLAGYGGLNLVSRIYEVIAVAIEKKLRNKINPE